MTMRCSGSPKTSTGLVARFAMARNSKVTCLPGAVITCSGGRARRSRTVGSVSNGVGADGHAVYSVATAAIIAAQGAEVDARGGGGVEHLAPDCAGENG